MAIWSLVLGILSCTCLSVFAGVPAIFCGHASLRLQARDPLLRGKPMAVAGMSLGYISVLIALVAVFWFVAKTHMGVGGTAQRDKAQQTLHDARLIREAASMAEVAARETGRRGGWPLDTGASSAEEFKGTLLAVNLAGLDRVDFGQFLVGNVTSGDPGDTVFVKSRIPTPGGFTVVVCKDGRERLLGPNQSFGRTPPRDPAFLP